MPTKSRDCIKEQSLADWSSSPTARGNGHDRHAIIGLANSIVFRDLMQFETIPWSDWHVYQIDDAYIEAWTTNHNGIAPGGTPRPIARRIDGTWQEDEGSEDSWSADASTKYPGPAVAGSEIDSGSVTDSEEHKIRISVLGYVEAIAPSSVLRKVSGNGGGETNRGVRLTAYDEGSTSRRLVIHSRRSTSDSKRPRLVLVYKDNEPPALPGILSPAPSSGDPTIVATPYGNELTVEFTFTDPDDTSPGGGIVEVWEDGSTDATANSGTAGGDRLGTTGGVVPRSLGAGNYAFTLVGLPPRTVMRQRTSIADPIGAWSGWTSLNDGRIQTAYLPGLPLGLSMASNPEHPDISATLNSNDPSDFATRAQVIAWRDDQTGTTTLWPLDELDVGNGSSRRVTIPWQGQSVTDGDVISWRVALANRDGIFSALSPVQSQVMQTQIGPTITPGDLSTKLTTREPSFTITFPSESTYYEWHVYARDGLRHYERFFISPATSAVVTLPANHAGWGETLQITAAARPTTAAVDGPTSAPVSVYIDTLPSTVLTTEDEDGLVYASVVPTTDIPWHSPYNDPDVATYGEHPVAKELEISTAATPQGSGILLTSRTSLYPQAPELERTGRTIDLLVDHAGWVADADVTAFQTGNVPTGYSPNSLTINATGGSAAERGATYTFPEPLDLSVFGGGALLFLWNQITSAANLTKWKLVFAFTGGGTVTFDLITAVFSWSEHVMFKSAPSASTGTVDWSSVVSMRFAVVPSGAYTGDLNVRDLRIGLTQRNRIVPDNSIAPETSVDARVRWRDDADPRFASTLAATAIAATNLKLASVAGLLVGDPLTIVPPAPVYQNTVTITAVGTAGMGGTGVDVDRAVDGTSGWDVKVYPWGPWSGWITRKASLPPVVVATSPADHAVVVDPTPTLTHTYTSSGGKAQVTRTLWLYRRRGYYGHIRDSGASSHWKLSEPSGTFADSIGAVTGTLSGGATRGVAGLSYGDDAVDLNGTTGVIGFGDSYDFAGTAPFGVAALIRPDALTTDLGPIIAKDDGTSGWWLYVPPTGALVFHRRVAGFATSAASVAGLVVVGETYHVAATYDGTASRIYLNGLLVGAIADVSVLPGNAQALTVGGSPGRFWNGVIDEVTVWADDITPATIAALAGKAMEVPVDELLYLVDTDGTGLTDTLPALLLEDGAAYAWELVAYDTDALYGSTTRRSFSTRFTTPDAVAGLVATVDDDRGAIVLTWTASADPYFDHYRVYWRDQSGQLQRVDGGPVSVDDGLPPLTDPAFVFYDGRFGANEFVVTVHNGALESIGSTVVATLVGPRPGSWFVSGIDERYVFAFDPDAAPRTVAGAVETFAPPGRQYPLHLHWGTSGRHVSLSMTYVPTEDGDLSTRWRELVGNGRRISVKAPGDYIWDVLACRVTGISDQPGRGGLMSVSVDLDEVDRADA